MELTGARVYGVPWRCAAPGAALDDRLRGDARLSWTHRRRRRDRIRGDGLVGASVPWAGDNHWIDAAVADAGAELVGPPHCVWSTVVPPGRRELAEIAMPCMGLALTIGGRRIRRPSRCRRCRSWVSSTTLPTVSETARAADRLDRRSARANARHAGRGRVGMRRADVAPGRRCQRPVRRHRGPLPPPRPRGAGRRRPPWPRRAPTGCARRRFRRAPTAAASTSASDFAPSQRSAPRYHPRRPSSQRSVSRR